MRFTWLTALLIVTWVVLPPVALAQEPASEYFTETGQTVRGEFLKVFRDRGGPELFGPPISPELMEDGVRLQYFRNVRLEWHPENPRPYRVQLGLVGEMSSPRQAPISASMIPPATRADERYYKETGHTVKAGFLTFFDRSGGIDTFGYPISEVLVGENNRLVQWFQRARFEWISDEATGHVALSPLGEGVFRKRYPEAAPNPTGTGSARAGDNALALLGTITVTPEMTFTPPNLVIPPARPGVLRMSASVSRAFTGGSEGTQRVTVFVADEQDNVLPGVPVRVVVKYPSNRVELTLQPTNAQGFTSLSFPVQLSDEERGLDVVVEALASYEGASSSTQTSFTPWY